MDGDGGKQMVTVVTDGDGGKQMVMAVICWNGWQVRKCVSGL
jgi:hypothetical protein